MNFSEFPRFLEWPELREFPEFPELPELRQFTEFPRMLNFQNFLEFFFLFPKFLEFLAKFLLIFSLSTISHNFLNVSTFSLFLNFV